MTFKTKRDRFFINLWVGLLLFINVIFLVPLIFSPPKAGELLTVIILDIIITGFLAWIAIDIKYVLLQDHLVVKGGLFKSRIQYRDITRITRNPNIWVGYKILFSQDALEVHYKTGILGSVIISPVDKELFINEMKKRNGNLKVEGGIY
ncbi:hypothetical protein Back11_57400 [Paenibacillus baekrokdamisoli]|uniref:Uncharacterized protein YyaB-like PH domain-containing protein n=1 Tax=Paenibacillus baekrokdamisoli TaxID=1712516 RepID=A0A3G9J7S4_9BACL|nr:PH domain-containing protein [Paenibacillus baekrokdamisoli]MBB3072835.1 hypothetical protein [Paenibacillus baekrokdamisoli]BBH24395.1 hypothetical protein Back11_57400 [Paenibacillus baekrokdamisoli]